MPRKRNCFLRRIACLEGIEPGPTALCATILAGCAALLSFWPEAPLGCRVAGASLAPISAFFLFVARERWKGRGEKAKSLSLLSRSLANFDPYIDAWRRGRTQERTRVAQDHLDRGLYQSTAHASAQLSALREGIASLRAAWGVYVDKPLSDVLLESGMADLHSVDSRVAEEVVRHRATVCTSRNVQIAETRKVIETAYNGLGSDILASFYQAIEEDTDLTGEWP